MKFEQTGGNLAQRFDGFARAHSPLGATIDLRRVERAMAALGGALRINYARLSGQYSEDCIYVGCLLFALLQAKPIVPDTDQPPQGKSPALGAVNEEFAIYVALAQLRISPRYIADRNILPNLLRSLIERRGNLSAARLVEYVQDLCNAVPVYFDINR
jgi:hypothetical protein